LLEKEKIEGAELKALIEETGLDQARAQGDPGVRG
jgi:hypothetical protein